MVDEDEDETMMYMVNNNRSGMNANNYVTSGTGSRPIAKAGGGVFPKASSPIPSVIPKSITKNLTVLSPHLSLHKKNQESIHGTHNLIYQ